MYDYEKKGNTRDYVPRASLLDELKQKFYENVIAREDTHIAAIDFSDLVSFFMKSRENHEDAEQCLVYYEIKKGKYEICQVMLDKNNEELRINNKMCVGRRMVVSELSPSVLKWFDGKTSKIMNKSNIL